MKCGDQVCPTPPLGATTTCSGVGGSCGISCGSRQCTPPPGGTAACSSAGKCVYSTCDSDTPNYCPRASGGAGTCVNLRYDPNNCGTCGEQCAGSGISNARCIEGTCSGTCSTAAKPDYCFSYLMARCTNLASDPLNCGSCGNACSPGFTAGAAYCQNAQCCFFTCPTNSFGLTLRSSSQTGGYIDCNYEDGSQCVFNTNGRIFSGPCQSTFPATC